MNGSLPPLPTADDTGECDGGGDAVDDGANSENDDSAGFGTLFGHPYGALPYGNIHLATPPTALPTSAGSCTLGGDPSSRGKVIAWHPDIVRHRGLGPLLRVLNDEQLLSILSFVDGPTLAGGVVTSSRFLYVAGHHEELWRDLVLRRWGESGFTVPSPNDDLTRGEEKKDVANTSCKDGVTSKKQNSGCWKDIYAYNHRQTTKQKSKLPPKRHEPIPVDGIYSDTFFRSFLCRSFALQPSWLATHTVPALHRDIVTTELFLKEYEERNMPLLIKGASKGWPALQGSREWNTDYLLNATEGKTFRATSGAAPLPAQFTLADYVNYCASSTEEAPLYLFDRTFATKCPQLLADFDTGLKESCGWWSRGNAEAGHDLFSVLGERGRPDYQWLIIGPKRSGSCFHIDPNCTHAWNAPIIGRKRWIFYPPGVTPPGVFPSPSGDDVCMPISIGEWFLTFWNAHVERRADPDVSRRPLECTACPGDVLFVPHGWWHMVLNIGDEDDGVGEADDRGVSVALTRNYVSASNLSDVLRFLDTRVSQISGCRDREDAVTPEELGREFRKALLSVDKDTVNEEGVDGEEKKCDESQDSPDKRKWAGLVEKCEKRAKEGWECDAWADLSPAHSNCGANISCENGSSGTNDQRKNGSSILARAKQPSSTTEDVAVNVSSSVGAASLSSFGGFSFSFL